MSETLIYNIHNSLGYHILGPILFQIFVNNLFSIVHSHSENILTHIIRRWYKFNNLKDLTQLRKKSEIILTKVNKWLIIKS